MNWIIGTIILWVLKFVSVKFSQVLAGDKVKQVAPVSPVPTSETDVDGQPVPAPAPAPAQVIPTGYYILADVIVMGVAGGLLGVITGYYFIGISIKPKDWPGMIVFILSSLVGSFIHG